jgi:hypothetical protein
MVDDFFGRNIWANSAVVGFLSSTGILLLFEEDKGKPPKEEEALVEGE